MLLDYIKHTNVTSALDTINKIRAYAVSKGWTQEEWYDGYEWGATGSSPPYGFIVDANHCYLRMTSTGYGTTEIDAVLHTYEFNSAMQVACITTNSTETLDTADQRQPYRQLALAMQGFHDSSGVTIENETYDELYIFGDDKWICAVMNMDGVYVQFMHFGQFEMFDENCTNGTTYGMTGQHDSYHTDTDYTAHSNLTSDNYHQAFFMGWTITFGAPAWGYACHDVQWDDSDTPNNYMSGRGYATGTIYDMRLALNFWSPDTNSAWLQYDNAYGDKFWNVDTLLNANTWSNNRVLMKGTYFGKSRVDDTWKPICRTSYYFCMFSGLSIGQILTYGSQQYMCFPIGRATWKWGVAFRIV